MSPSPLGRKPRPALPLLSALSLAAGLVAGCDFAATDPGAGQADAAGPTDAMDTTVDTTVGSDAAPDAGAAGPGRTCAVTERWGPIDVGLVGDLDGDGRDDAITWTQPLGWVWVSDLRTAATSSAPASTPLMPDGASFALNHTLAGDQGSARWAQGDVDGDGDADLVLAVGSGLVYTQAGGMWPNVFVLLGDGGGGFTVAFELVAHGQVDRLALVDLDGDGDLDLGIGAQGRKVGSDAHVVAKEGRCYLSAAMNHGDGTWGHERTTNVWEAPLGPSLFQNTVAYCGVADLDVVDFAADAPGDDVLVTAVGTTEVGAVNGDRSSVRPYRRDPSTGYLEVQPGLGLPKVDTPDLPAFEWRYVPTTWAEPADVDGDGDLDVLTHRFIHLNKDGWFPMDDIVDLGEAVEQLTRFPGWAEDVDGDGDMEILLLTTTSSSDGQEPALAILDPFEGALWLGDAPLDWMTLSLEGYARSLVAVTPEAFACDPTSWD